MTTTKQNTNIEYTRGSIFWADLGEGNGSEQSGKRPVVIIQNDIGNRYSPTVVITTLTTRLNKKPIPTHVKLNKDDYEVLGKDSVALLEQVRTIDKNRLTSKVCDVNKKDMRNIDRALLVSLGFGNVKLS